MEPLPFSLLFFKNEKMKKKPKHFFECEILDLQRRLPNPAVSGQTSIYIYVRMILKLYEYSISSTEIRLVDLTRNWCVWLNRVVQEFGSIETRI